MIRERLQFKANNRYEVHAVCLSFAALRRPFEHSKPHESTTSCSGLLPIKAHFASPSLFILFEPFPASKRERCLRKGRLRQDSCWSCSTACDMSCASRRCNQCPPATRHSRRCKCRRRCSTGLHKAPQPQTTSCASIQPVMQSSSARSALACAGGFLRGKFSPRQGRSNNLSPKHGPHNYYKGNGCPSLGNITKKGKFIVDWDKVPQLMVPNISVSKIKPYVTYATEKPAAEKSSP